MPDSSSFAQKFTATSLSVHASSSAASKQLKQSLISSVYRMNYVIYLTKKLFQLPKSQFVWLLKSVSQL